MKKVFIVSKYLGPKEQFLFKVKDAYYWTYEAMTATKFVSSEEAETALLNIPDHTTATHFRIQTFYIKEVMRLPSLQLTGVDNLKTKEL
jgi:hypothetical protein